jgi:spore germination protein
MYSRWSAVLFPVVVVALIFSMQWGGQQANQKDKVTIKAENQYQRAFHDLVYHLEQIQTQLGNALAVDAKSGPFHQENLITISRLTSDAQNEINQLPLVMLPFQQTEQFLSNLNKFTYQLALRNYEKEPLTIADKNRVEELYTHAKQLSEDLTKLREVVINEKLKWTDAEFGIASDSNKKANPIVDGFNALNQRVSQYKELDWGPTITGTVSQSIEEPLPLNPKSKNQIRKLAIQKLSLNAKKNIQILPNGKGNYFKSYHVNGKDENNQTVLADFSRAGGELLWFMKERQIGKIQLKESQAVYEAKQWLDEWKFPNMVPIAQDRYDGISMITLAEDSGGVLHYPHKLTIRVAMDNGEVIGIQATDFVYAKHQKIALTPKLSMDEAKTHLDSTFKVKSARLVTILNNTNIETLCYEFIGQTDHASFRLYMNATNGQEEKLERVPE